MRAAQRAGSSRAEPRPAQGQRRRRRLVVERAAHGRRGRRRRRRQLSVRRRWSRTSSQLEGLAAAQPAARIVQPAQAPAVDGQQFVAGATPARSAALPRSTLLTCTPVSAPSLTRRPSCGGEVRRCRLPVDAGARQQRAQRQLVGAVHPGGQFRAEARPATSRSAAAMSASSIGPPPLRAHSWRITSSSVAAAVAQR